MFRRKRLFRGVVICGLGLVVAWQLGLLRDISTKPNNKFGTLLNIKEKIQRNSKPVDVKEVIRKRSPPKPTEEKPLPVLSAEPQDRYYGKGCGINRNRERLQKLLNEWQKIVIRRNITQYFICFGSFLGSVRNGDLIPYDKDMDVCMFRSDYHKLFPEESKRPLNLNDGTMHMLLQKHAPHPKTNVPRLNCKGKIVRHFADMCSILNPHGRLCLGKMIRLDIFLLEDQGAEFWDEYRDRFHPRDTILPLRPCKYLGIDTMCPNNATKYLNVYYGKDYTKPHHICKDGKWVENMAGARKPFV